MTSLVSNRWLRMAAMVAPMSVAWIVLILHGPPWIGFAWLSLAFVAVFWPVRAMPAPKPVLRSKGDRP